MVNNGPRHQIVGIGPRLGSHIDPEPDGQPTNGANGDDLDAIDDEDGVNLPVRLTRGQQGTVTVTVTGTSGYLVGWIDFDRNGSFDVTNSEQIIDSVLVSVGARTFAFDVPATATLGDTFARFRISTFNGLGPAGPASNGEVEDYVVTISDGANCSVNAVRDDAATDQQTPIEYVEVLLNDLPLPEHPLANFTYTATHVASGDSGIDIYNDGGYVGTMFASRDQGLGHLDGACADMDFTFGDLVAASYTYDPLSKIGTALYVGGWMDVTYNGQSIAHGDDLIQMGVYDFNLSSPTY